MVDAEHLCAHGHREVVLGVGDLQRVQDDAAKVALGLRRAICDAGGKSETVHDNYEAWMRSEWA